MKHSSGNILDREEADYIMDKLKHLKPLLFFSAGIAGPLAADACKIFWHTTLRNFGKFWDSCAWSSTFEFVDLFLVTDDSSSCDLFEPEMSTAAE